MDFIKSDGDFTTSTEKALNEIDPKWKKLPGVIVFGTHGFKDVEAKLELIRKARVNKIPFFGECAGFELMCIEYARNVLGLHDANSTEIKPLCADPVIHKNPDGLRVGIFDADGRKESFWHSYRFNPYYLDKFYKDWTISTQGDVVVRMELGGHPFFVGTQYHPSYGSSKWKPHPVLVRFLKACKEYAKRS